MPKWIRPGSWTDSRFAWATDALARKIARTGGCVMRLLLLGIMVYFVGSSAQGRRHYPSMPHNTQFKTTCTTSLPSVYNPNISNSMEGGPLNRFGETINSVEDAARNGRPVTVAMDFHGEFGLKCNKKSARCLLLVQVPGFDRTYPKYARRFPHLPSNSFLAVVEDTGGAFVNKGTGKIDIPFRTGGLHVSNSFGRATFAVVTTGSYRPSKARSFRTTDLSTLRPFETQTRVASLGETETHSTFKKSDLNLDHLRHCFAGAIRNGRESQPRNPPSRSTILPNLIRPTEPRILDSDVLPIPFQYLESDWLNSQQHRRGKL